MIKIKTGKDLRKFREKYRLTREDVSNFFFVPVNVVYNTEVKHKERRVSKYEYRQYNNRELRADAKGENKTIIDRILYFIGL